MASLLDIQTLIERPQIAIDGQPYEIMSSEELPLLTSQRVAALGVRLDKLMKTEELDAAGQAQLKATLTKIGDIIMQPIPPEVRAKLSEAQVMAVIEVFTLLSLGRKVRLAGAMVGQAKLPNAPTGPTGATPSPGSNGSTAATPPAG